MKTFFLFVFALSTWSALAQTYYPFIKTGVYRDEFWAPELQLCNFSYGNTYWFRGDTSMNGQVYQVLLHTGIQGDPTAPQLCPPYTVDTSAGLLYAFMRENIVEKQVFQYNTTTNTEFLLFDFSVQVGDSVTVGDPPQTVYIQQEAYETWADGSSRRTLTVNLSFGQTYWLESLGNRNNLWNPVAQACICPHGFCYQENGQFLYGTVCAEIVASKEPKTMEAGMVLRPNPARETIRIGLSENQTFDHLEIFDLAGQIYTTQYFPNAAFREVPIQSWPIGSYIAVVWQNGHLLERQIFQKQ